MKKIVSLAVSFALMTGFLGLSSDQKIPDPPGELLAVAVYDQINLSWRDYSDNEKGFAIERKALREDYEEIVRLSADTEYYLDMQLQQHTIYSYRVYAFNDFGKSRYSNEASARTEAPPPPEVYDAPLPPTDLNARVINEREVELTWKDQSTNEDGFIIERRTPSTQYDVLKEIPANQTSHVDQTVEPRQFYYYRVKAYNLVGESPYSNEVIVETRIIERELPPVEEPPEPPSDLTGALEGREIVLKWKDNSGHETGFRIYYAMDDIDNISLYRQVPQDTTQHRISDLYLPGKTFFFNVTAFNSFGESNPTDMVMIRIPQQEEQARPQPPENLRAEEIYERDVVLKWDIKSDNEEGFKIERRKVDESAFRVIVTVPKATNTYRDPGLESGATYFYRVHAFNDAGSSWPSNTLEVRTKGVTGGYTPPEAKIVIVLQIGNNQMTVNGKVVEMDARPTIYQGRTLLPIRPVIEALGGDIDFEPHSKTITIKLKSITIIMQLNNPEAKVNGITVLIDPDNPNVVPLVVPPGRTLVPLRFVAENLGCKVDWEPNEKKITITLEL